jgi:Zn-dependent M28 family amino/carboxypeptidase
MTGIGGERYEVGPVPTAFITAEGYGTIWRLLQRGAVEMEVELTNGFSDAPVEVYNTVGEIRGSEKPDEVVILGAHLDSWDLGTGATDNGTGSMAVLEAARALEKLDLKPKRTIRFVLFTGEEQGLVGSKRYVEAHKAELDKISAALVHDTGTGRVLALGLHDNYPAREIVDRVLAPLSSLKLLEPSMDRSFGTDHASFDDAGVPGFHCIQETAEYRKTHHSQSDTFDKVWKNDLVQGAQVLAAWAYNTAQLPEMLPRRPVPPPAERAAGTEAAPPDPIAEMNKKILEQVKNDKDEMMANLRHLTDRIGPRVTGSAQLDQASHWTAEQFRSAGLANVTLEPWTISSAWTRGTARGRILAPAEQTLVLTSAGWSPGTKGALRGSVTGIKAQKPEDLAQYKGKLKGAIVLVGPAMKLDAPHNPILAPYDQPALPLAMPRLPGEKFDLSAFIKMWRAEIEFFKQEGVAAVLFPSDKWYGLLNVFSMSRGTYQPGGFPLAFVSGESHHLLWRLLDAGPVQVELEIQNTFSKKPVEVYNTVAEIPGAEKPDEIVIVGAHLDSWDLGTGATDNGTGSMAVLEAARALQKLGVKPKRTIRFVLFTGEEQGLNGSRKYVEAHKAELGKISGVLVHDTGTGRVLTVGMMGNYAALETMHRVLYPLASVGLVEPSLRTEGGSDHVPFDEAGVPASWCIQEPVDYDKTHHSQADTLDRVRPDDLMQGAQVLAVWAYDVAQLPDLLPRKPAPPPKPPETSPH